MAAHNTLGQSGENAAAAYLERNGYVIRHRNWRQHHLELDIVSAWEGTLVVVEVKTRSTTDFQEPQEAVDGKKIRHIVRATDAYLRQYCLDCPVRFDIITAVGSDGKFHIEHIKDAFQSPLF